MHHDGSARPAFGSRPSPAASSIETRQEVSPPVYPGSVGAHLWRDYGRRHCTSASVGARVDMAVAVRMIERVKAGFRIAVGLMPAWPVNANNAAVRQEVFELVIASPPAVLCGGTTRYVAIIQLLRATAGEMQRRTHFCFFFLHNCPRLDLAEWQQKEMMSDVPRFGLCHRSNALVPSQNKRWKRPCGSGSEVG